MDDRVEHFTVISLDEQNQTIVTYEERKSDYCVVDPLTETPKVNCRISGTA